MKDVLAKVTNTGLHLYDARSSGFVKVLNTTTGIYVSAAVSGGTLLAQRKDGKVDTYETETGRFLRTI